MIVLSLLLCGVVVNAHWNQKPLEVHFEWKYFDYAWPNHKLRSLAIESGDYNHTKITPIDVDVHAGRTFVTAIRDKGVPASLMTVSNERGPGGPLLVPYPDWSWAAKGDCNAITSVYRVTTDECGRLWVLDTGKIGDDRVCPAQLLAFDMFTDTLIKRIKVPNDIATDSKGNGLLVTPVVDLHGNCEAYTVYLADVEGGALITYDGHHFRRLDSDVFAYDSNATKFTIQGESFDLPDGVLGLAISPTSTEPKMLFFRSLASYAMNSVHVATIMASRRSNDIKYHRQDNILPSQATALAISSKGTLFFVLTTETAVTCWNTNRHLSRNHMAVVAQDPVTLQFASGLKIKNNQGKEDLWIMTNRLQKIYAGTMNFNEVNFRILKGSVDRLVANTVCN